MFEAEVKQADLFKNDTEGKRVATWEIEMHSDWKSLQKSFNAKSNSMFRPKIWSDSKWCYFKYHHYID